MSRVLIVFFSCLFAAIVTVIVFAAVVFTAVWPLPGRALDACLKIYKRFKWKK